MGVVETRTFKSGNSVAVRLPRELGFAPDIRVTVERNGRGINIQPVIDPDEEKRKLDELLGRLRVIGPVGEIGSREPIDIPERPGL